MQTPLIKETCLDVEDLARAKDFYCDLFRFEVVAAHPAFCALSVAGQHLLLLFVRGASLDPGHIPGGTIPPHGCTGAAHVGFSIPKEDLDPWEGLLKQKGIEIKGRVTWPRGGKSIYFRDPDGHLLELLTPGVWSVY
jgi:catechol 2,3-dioxygenase-like lactoylglutathione lyase family enzyme